MGNNGSQLKDPVPGVAQGSAEAVFLARRCEVPDSRFSAAFVG